MGDVRPQMKMPNLKKATKIVTNTRTHTHAHWAVNKRTQNIKRHLVIRGFVRRQPTKECLYLLCVYISVDDTFVCSLIVIWTACKLRAIKNSADNTLA